MTSAEPPPTDAGLITPYLVGSPAEATTSDAALLQAMLDAEVALAKAWQTVGEADLRVLESCAVAEAFDLRSIALRSRDGGNPVIPMIADLRIAVKAAGGDPGIVHRGATSQDILDTALALVAVRTADVIRPDLVRLAGALAGLANRHRDTVQVARTLTQHAVPTTFGLTAAQWLLGVVDAADRLATARDALPAQLGGAGGTLAALTGVPGTGLAIAERFAAELGLVAAPAPWHVQRAPLLAVASAIGALGAALGTLAVDVALRARPEFGELTEPAAEGRGGSSAMPQKRNPVLSILVHAGARRIPSLLGEVHQAAIAIDERPDGAWHAEWAPFRDLLRTAGGAAALAAELAEGLEVDTGRMRANLDAAGPAILGERLVAVLGPELGTDRVIHLTERAAAEPTFDLAAELRLEPGLTGIDVDALLDPEEYLGESRLLIDRALARAQPMLPEASG